MSDFGWGHTDVRIHNQPLANMKPDTIYEFGLNLIYKNDTFGRFPTPGSGDICACKTHADVPSKPLNLQYHYLQENQYSLEWTPDSDNGEPIITYDLKTAPIDQNQMATLHQLDWKTLIPYNLTENRMNFALDTQEHSALQLRAVNKIGPGPPVFITIQPPLKKITGQSNDYSSSLFGSLNSPNGVITYSLVVVGLLLSLLLVVIAFVYRRRRKDGKPGKTPFLISFNPARRMNSGSGNDSFGLGIGSDLTTSGVPLDLPTMEPLWNQEVNSLYGMGKSDSMSFEQVNQISAANIRFQRYIGCGAFGKVWEGWLHVQDVDGSRFEKVALKVRNNKSLTEAEFRREAKLMHRYQHANIVRFFGVSFDSPGQQCLVLEMMDQGNLRDYLHRSRPRLAPNVAANMFAAAAICAAGSSAADIRTLMGSEGSSINTSTTSTAPAVAGAGTTVGFSNASNVITLTAQLDLPALVSIMRDISHGCRYLEEQHFVHRDIAARNCLVSHNDPSGRIVKLCDFGLARDIYKNDFYRKRNEPKLPVRWMSPEAIRDGLFTSKSDVWAFAVTCWEVMTLGADPFYGRANADVMNLVIGGHVLGRPENCPEELYNQMLQCWSRFPEMRPSFADLAKKMNEFVQFSHQTGSSFFGPFIVSLPLPKSLPDASGQTTLLCASNKQQTQSQQISDVNRQMMQQKIQRRASFNEIRSYTPANSLLMENSMPMDRGAQLEQPTTCPANGFSARGYAVDPEVANFPNVHSSISANTLLLANRNAANECKHTISETSPESAARISTAPTNAHTDSIFQGYVTGQINKEYTFNANMDGNKSFTISAVRKQSITNNSPVIRPFSLFENPTRFGNYESRPAYNNQTIGGRVGSTLPCTHNSVIRSNSTTTQTGESKTGSHTINYWLLGTGGGVDSLGYERPSWTSQVSNLHSVPIAAANVHPLPTSYASATSTAKSSITERNRPSDYKPRPNTGAL
ncbi:Proto-oncogene tyrosine-protein kinase ROS [Paragonimus heterotremus]|uniref:receptor protein-tyrosine kinase n=1 Tax=Paragonimus heterotremus TaxID=100268 RepID=A0A8J4TS27_9TREM|nr:Proto-oncogene tyrosine-protein kinase ROS [Paragonimus heterotremus]